MAFLKLFKYEKGTKKSISRKYRTRTTSSLKKIISKSLNKIYRTKSNDGGKPRMIASRKYPKDDIFATRPSRESIKARSRSHTISYDLRPTLHLSHLTPDEKTFLPVKNVSVKVNVFWGEDQNDERFGLSIPRTGSFGSLQVALSKCLGYEMPHDFAILYHTRRYRKDYIMMRILLDYWLKNRMLWLVDNDFMFRKHMLLWRDQIEITIVRKSIIY
ncbi:3114_t:CDS:1 [Funneliformis caledonium]|uniref:3114_t:CDS:1 n=1 Tax=Funneliformis caledonium TaxID=1117310 RepID=A0A9N9CRQ5_9GLOM|nr:3114_t:CDS:1 [Funneliformis caledonium]